MLHHTSRVERRKSGSYFTGSGLQEELVTSALKPALESRLQEAEDAEQAVLEFKVVDPACGTGALLVPALDYLAQALSSVRGHARGAAGDVLRNCIHGVDRDPLAAELARAVLKLHADANDAKPHIRCGDALIGAPLTDLASPRALDRRTASLFSHPCRFIHWQHEFEEVFNRPEKGFDCVLANPPWERIKVQEREFFQHEVAGTKSAADRRKRIEELKHRDPALHASFRAALERSEALSRYFRRSGRYPLAVSGDPNTYLFFASLCRDLLAARGRAGLIVPSGIATDKSAAPFFRDLMESQSLVSLFDFMNTERLFPGIAGPNRFCLLTLSGREHKVKRAVFQFYSQSLDDLKHGSRRFSLSRSDLELLNPNTRTCPPFVDRKAAKRVKTVYRRVPVLADDGGKTNPWQVKLWSMFHMSSHSHLFRTREQLEARGFKRGPDRHFRRNGETWVRLYEAKLMHNLNHRYNTFEGVDLSRSTGVKPGTRPVDSSRLVEPRYWVPEKEVVRAVERAGWKGKWFLAMRSITNVATNRRSAVAAVLPWCGVANSAAIVQTSLGPKDAAVLAACLTSFAFDYVARAKLGGPNMNFFIIKQLPVPEPSAFDRPFRKGSLKAFIARHALELIYTSRDLAPFARDFGYADRPFPFDEKRRADVRAELDALFFILYGMDRSEADEVLDTFPILERKERARHGEYRTKRLIMKAFDRI